jgi:acetoacetate decarboxylase
MKRDGDKIYTMPLLAGPLAGKRDQLPYPDAEGVLVQYETGRQAIAALLPDCYQPGEEPVVTVFFGYHRQLPFLAGGGYNLATVQVRARFDGQSDHVEGDYILVMFENKTVPIIGGREHLGVPKLYADIPPVKTLPDGRLRCEASLWGHLLFGIELPDLKKQNPLVRLAAGRQFNERPWLAYKYIERLDGPPDADYPTVTYNDLSLDELWLGKSATLYFGFMTADDLSWIANVMEALKTLSIHKILRSGHFRGSAVLRYDKSRRLL